MFASLSGGNSDDTATKTPLQQQQINRMKTLTRRRWEGEGEGGGGVGRGLIITEYFVILLVYKHDFEHNVCRNYGRLGV